MITLLIDTSSSDVSIAILTSGKVLSEITENKPNQLSIYSVEYINKTLKEAKLSPDDINRIMVVTGPGSFTGLRIGVTIAKTYAYLKEKEIIPVSSLKMRALSTEHDNCISIIDAHHNKYYVGLYDKENKDIIEEQLMTKEDLLKLIEEYSPKIVSDLPGKINDISYSKQELNFESIEKYYKSCNPVNPHLVNPNYLKLPQVLEVNND